MSLVARFLLLPVLVLSAQSGALNAQVPPPQVTQVRVELLSAPEIRVRVRQEYEQPIQVRVLREFDSQPVAFLPVNLDVVITLCFPGQPGCVAPPNALYGQFVSGNGGSYFVQLSTDAQGIATAPRFRGGSLNGIYAINARVSSSQNPGGFSSGNRDASVVVVQGGAIGGPERIPMLGPHAFAALGLLLLVLGWLSLMRGHRFPH